MNCRSRAWTLTLNYFDELDFEELTNSIDYTDYAIFGFEGVDSDDPKHPHIHLYLHFQNARSLKSVKSMFTKQHHIEVVKDNLAMIEYCKGYKNGKLKWIRENHWLEFGTPPVNGVNKSSQLVIDAIQSGKTLEEIEELFPSYSLHHYQKLQDLYHRKRQITNDKGVWLDVEEYQLTGDEDVIYDFSDIVNTTKDTVVWYRSAGTSFPKQMFDNYSKHGLPFRVKYGYKYLVVKPKKVIVVTDLSTIKK